MGIEGQGTKQSPFDTQIFRVGQEGLNILKSLDMLSMSEASQMQNCLPQMSGRLLTRPGQALFGGGGAATNHTTGRLNDPSGGTSTHFFGVGTTLARGLPSSVIDSGYSGDPLVMLQFRPPLAPVTYMYIADRTRMSKATITGNRLPIGLPAPASSIATINAALTKNFAAFDTSDNTNALFWASVGWYSTDGTTQSNPPTFTDVGGFPLSGSNALQITTVAGAAAKGYPSVAWTQRPLDLSKFSDGVTLTNDEDMVHIWMWFSKSVKTLNVKIYFTISSYAAVTADAIAPSPDREPLSSISAYVGTITPSDFDSITDSLATSTWTEFGIVDFPFRKGDFIKQGNAGAPGADWSSITGIAIVINTVDNTTNVGVAFDAGYISGGSGPDDSEPTSTPYDWRVTNYDPRTGAESNPSPAPTGNPTDVPLSIGFFDAVRQSVSITPPAFGDAAVRQRFYRRGGTLPTDWFFVGTNTADGGSFIDNLSDNAISAAGSVFTDHDQPITTVNASGTTVLAQPLPFIWGPVSGLIMGCGDPFRPGHLYWCKPGEPDHWPAVNIQEICAPSEELMAGGVYGGQAFVFSRERAYSLYTNLASTSDQITASPSDCIPGMINRWGMCIGPDGIYYVARDGVRVTRGGPSQLISEQIKPLFNGLPRNGYFAIDMTATTSIRLEHHNSDIWFIYKDTQGNLQCLVYSTLYKNWRPYTFANQPVHVYNDPTQNGVLTLMMGDASGNSHTHSGTDDNGAGINAFIRTGALDFGYPRGNTQFGEIVVDADMGGQALTVGTYLNNESITNTAQAVATVNGRRRYIFEPFGTDTTGPQKARNVSINISWQGITGVSPIIDYAGVSVVPQPNVTFNRATTWDTLAEAEVYLNGIWVDCDTGTSSRTVFVEYDLNGAIAVASTLIINPNGVAGRHKWWFSWPAVHANMVRLRPSDNCIPWELYEYRWISQPEPPRIAGWDTNFENKGDSYYTGLDIECDTFGITKTIQISVDQNIVQTSPVVSNGRTYVHITLPAGRGHIFRFVSTDNNPGLLYAWKWLTEVEPGEQTNWNQNYTVAGTMSDKFLKGAIIQCDTFGQNKTVTFEVDGVVINTSTVNTNGRKVAEVSFPQSLGRVFRMIPTDNNPGRLYSMEWIFDEEPLALSRWETQELDLEDFGWKTMPTAFVTIKSNSDVTLTTTVYGQSGTVMTTLVNTIPSTGGLKQKVYVPFAAHKGMLHKFVFTCASAFWLYREESYVVIQAWGQTQTKIAHPFGNDDLDLVRGMRHASLAAERSGGGVLGGGKE